MAGFSLLFFGRFFGLQGRVGLLFVAGSIFTSVLSAGGCGTTSFGESGQVVVLAAGAGVSAVGVTRGIEIVGGSMADDGAAGIVLVCGSVLLFISTDTFFPMLRSVLLNCPMPVNHGDGIGGEVPFQHSCGEMNFC